jgi:hypothetical protein
MSDNYKIFRQIQEKDQKRKQYTNYEREDLIDEIIELQEREEQLQNNWNELKKWLEEKMSIYEYQEASNFYVALNKMQELENRKV